MRFLSVLFGLIAISVSLSFFLYSLKPVDAFGGNQIIQIRKGYGLQEISSELADHHLIRSKLSFTLYSMLSGASNSLKPGIYTISSAQSLPEIIKILHAGGGQNISVVIQEGMSDQEIDDLLTKNLILEKDELLNFDWKKISADYPFLDEASSLQGFLFPDTYQFSAGSNPETVIRTMLNNFRDKALPLFGFQSTKAINKSLIVASIVEKEVPFPKDRLLVAGIIYKRLKLDMPLQIDSAPETYKALGLPTEPISNPGLDAINSAVNPQKSNFLYYLSNPVNRHTIFSQTFEEHKANKIKYLQ